MPSPRTSGKASEIHSSPGALEVFSKGRMSTVCAVFCAKHSDPVSKASDSRIEPEILKTRSLYSRGTERLPRVDTQCDTFLHSFPSSKRRYESDRVPGVRRSCSFTVQRHTRSQAPAGPGAG